MNIKHLKQLLFSLTVVAVFMCCFSISAYAEWDGSGLPAGGGASAVSGSFKLPHADIDDIVGYRFSVYDEDGKKIGNGIDLYFKGGTKYYQNTSTNKKSHIDYYSEYKSDGTTSLSSIKYRAPSSDYVISSMPKTPTDMEDWLTQTNAQMIAEGCGAYTFDSATSYIIVEPLYLATLEGKSHYSLTVAEYAVYQSTQYGWTSYPTNPSNSYGTIANYLGGVFGRHLYATKTYSVFPTSPVTSSMLKESNKGVDTVLAGSSGDYNKASHILKYQMGMGVYTNKEKTFTIRYRNYFDDNNGVGKMADQHIVYGQSTALRKNQFTRTGYSFAGWKVRKTVDGTYYYKGYNSSGTLGWYVKDTCDEYGYVLYVDAGYVAKTVQPGDTVYLWAQWTPNKLTVNYYSNYADYCTYTGSPVTVSSDTNTKVLTQQFSYNSKYLNGLPNIQNSSFLYLSKTGYNPTGNWGTKESGGILVDQNAAFETGQELAAVFGLDLSTGNKSIDLYVQWDNQEPHFVDSNGNWADSGTVTIYVGNSFAPLDYVKALDQEDGDITPKAVVTSNNVPVDANGNTTTIGTYAVKYSVTDSAGLSGSYTLTVNVIELGSGDSISGRIRFINLNHFNTLSPNSKWRKNPLNLMLKNLLKNDLKDTTLCEQVWEFSAEDFEKTREWCLSKNKGSKTNEEFLEKFKKHQTKPDN